MGESSRADMFTGTKLAPGASEDSIRAAERLLGSALPEDYNAFLRFTNGFEGFLNDAYLMLWPVEQLHDGNVGYRMHEHFPGAILIGSDGSNTGYFVRRVDSGLEYRAFDFIERDLGRTEYLGATICDAIHSMCVLQRS